MFVSAPMQSASPSNCSHDWKHKDSVAVEDGLMSIGRQLTDCRRWQSLPRIWRHVRFQCTKLLANSTTLIAYWIAFGPHGPRALDPPGEGKSLVFHTFLVLTATLGFYAIIRSFAGNPPDTMTKEYQEESNELLRVCYLPLPSLTPMSLAGGQNANPLRSNNDPLPSRVSPRRATRVPAWSSLLPRRLKLPNLRTISHTHYPLYFPAPAALSCPSFLSFVHRAKKGIGRKCLGNPYSGNRPLGHRVIKIKEFLAVRTRETPFSSSGGVSIEASYSRSFGAVCCMSTQCLYIYFPVRSYGTLVSAKRHK